MGQLRNRSVLMKWGMTLGLIVAVLGLGQPCRAVETLFVDNVRIQTASEPALLFEDTTLPLTWKVAPSSSGIFRIGIDGAGSAPLSLSSSTTSAIFVGPNGVSIGAPFTPQTDLHGLDPAGPFTFRMEEGLITSAGSALRPLAPTTQAWDLEASQLGFDIKDATAGTTPFSILPEAPTDSLFIAMNGNVGTGTSTPEFIGTVNMTSAGAALGSGVSARHLNLNGGTGLARAIVQGDTGAETYLIDNGGLPNRKVVRTRLAGGKYLMSIMNDTLTTNREAPICIDLTVGNVGIRTVNPTMPLQVGDTGVSDGNGAHVTPGGVWTNTSSRSVKDDIQPITSEQARETVRALQPVGYRYKNEPNEKYVGFIAEDVPELVATNDRKGLAPMDITAVLTRVVQDQDRQLIEQGKQLAQERHRNDKLELLVESLMRRMSEMEQRNDVAARTK